MATPASRLSVYLPVVAAVTATLFGLDAWSDVLMAAAGPAWYESLAAAFTGLAAGNGSEPASAVAETTVKLGLLSLAGARARRSPAGRTQAGLRQAARPA
jgi:hypothetical protein